LELRKGLALLLSRFPLLLRHSRRRVRKPFSLEAVERRWARQLTPVNLTPHLHLVLLAFLLKALQGLSSGLMKFQSSLVLQQLLVQSPVWALRIKSLQSGNPLLFRTQRKTRRLPLELEVV